MAIPNCQHIVADLAAQYPQEWRKAHNPSGGGPETEAFIRRLAYVLHTTVDKRFGLVGKRGNPDDISDDALMWRGEGPGHDPTNGNAPVTAIDVIGGAGGPDPRPTWQVFDTLPGPGAWVKPQPVGGRVDGGTPPPPPPPPPAVDLTPVLDAIKALDAKVTAVAADVGIARFEANNAAVRALDIASLRVTTDALAAEVAMVTSKLDNFTAGEVQFPVYEGRFLGQRFTLTPKG